MGDSAKEKGGKAWWLAGVGGGRSGKEDNFGRLRRDGE